MGEVFIAIWKNNMNDTKITRICKVCGIEFKISPCISLRGENRGICCSNKCRGINMRKYPNGKPQKPIIIRRVNDKCDWCKKDITYVRSKSKRKYHYCSRECFIKHMTERQKTNTPQKCIICGTEFYCSKSQLKYRHRKTCSMKCRTTYAIKMKFSAGSNSPFWRGGVSSFNRLLRYSTEMKNWRKSVFKRDNYTCMNCGNRGNYIEAHHIRPYYEIIDEMIKDKGIVVTKQNKYDIISIAKQYNPLWDINNGKTLCKECHNETKPGRKKKA